MEFMEWKVAIHESKTSEKIIAFANRGHGMSESWWKETYNLSQNGLLWGVYQVPTGLRRQTI